MEWIITIDTESFDIDLASQLGSWVEYYQIGNFRIDDLVYVVVNNIEEEPYFKYILKVKEVNIDIEDQKYFNIYSLDVDELVISDQVARFEFVFCLDGKHKSRFVLDKVGLDYIPKRPMRNIGENKDLFKRVVQLFEDGQEYVYKPEEHVEPIIENVEEEIVVHIDQQAEALYHQNRLAFIEAFPKDKWETLNFDHFFQYAHLILNEFNTHIESHCLDLVYKKNSNFYTKLGKINDIELFIQHFRKEMHESYHGEGYKIDSLYHDFYYAANIYYDDLPYLYHHEVRRLCKQYDVEFTDLKSSLMTLTEKIKELNPEISHFTPYQLTQWIMVKFKIKRIPFEPVEETSVKLERYMSVQDVSNLLRILRRDRNVILNNVINFGGKDHIIEILKEENFLVYNVTSFYPFHDYVTFSSMDSQHRKRNEISLKNVYTILISDNFEHNINTNQFLKMIPFYIELTPKIILEEEDLHHLNPYLAKIDTKELFDLLTKLNDIFSKYAPKPLFFNKYILKNLVISDDFELIEYILYRFIPLIKMNNLKESEQETLCLDLVHEFLNKYNLEVH